MLGHNLGTPAAWSMVCAGIDTYRYSIPGISPEERERVFTPDSRRERERERERERGGVLQLSSPREAKRGTSPESPGDADTAKQARTARLGRERERESMTPFQPHRADAGAARTSPGRSSVQ